MKKFLNILLEIVLYIWQLPQNIVGLFVLLFYKPTTKKIYNHIYNDIYYYQAHSFPGGISLGKYIILGHDDRLSILHEHGHQIQSLYLGPLYLFIIGIPSITWASLYGRVIKPTHNGYYKFYTEKWADKLAGVYRN